MRISAVAAKAIKRILQQETKLKEAGVKSPASLTKKERKIIPSIIENLPESSDTVEVKLNTLAKSVIKKTTEARIKVLAHHIIPEYERREGLGQDVSAYIEKQKDFIKVLKGVVEECQK